MSRVRLCLPRPVRLMAVLWLCLSTPAALDLIVETTSWLAGSECCADDCEETGDPCTQQCVHCVCGGHNVTLPCPELGGVALTAWQGSPEARTDLRGLSGYLDPPFRPPVA